MPKKKEKTPLKKHQRESIDKIKRHNGVLLYHGLGSGKTLTALRASEEIKKPLSVIGPASLRGNFKKEKVKHKVKTPLDYSSYTKPQPKSQGILAFDEAHRMGRIESKRSRYPDEFKADKKVFLTGTPIRNEPSELIPLLRGIGMDVPRNKKKFYDKYVQEEKVWPSIGGILKGVEPGVKLTPKNMNELTLKAMDKVDYHKSSSKNFPRVIEEDVNVPMSDYQWSVYSKALDEKPTLQYKIKKGIPPSKKEAPGMNSFLNATRQISNTTKAYTGKSTPTPKLQRMVKDITEAHKANPNYKGVTYSNYLESGVHPMAALLKKNKIKSGVFTGETNDEERKKIIKNYNKGKIKHLLISGAGSEGLDLKGTRLVQTMEPHWNNARLKQVHGRAVRMGSHDHLPPSQRKVSIKNYFSTAREGKKGFTTDQYIKRLADDKDALNKGFLKALQNADIDDNNLDALTKSPS